MPKTSDIKPDRLKMLWYGDSGVGKTTFASQWPNAYFIDADIGLLSARHIDAEYDTFNDEDPSRPTAATKLDSKANALLKECPFETVVVDSITTISDLAMNRILFTNGRAGGTPQQQDWLQQMNWLKNFILKIKALPAHVIIIAHEETKQDDLTGAIKTLPMITGKLAHKLPLYFDEVYHIEALMKGSDINYRMLTKNSGRYTAKSRLGVFDTYEPTDYNHLMGKVKGA